MTETGKTIVTDFREAEYISGRFIDNQYPFKELSSSMIYSLSLIDEALIHIIDSYLNSREDSLTEECFEHLKKKIGKKAFPDFISGYSETFIPGEKKSFKNIQLLRDLITLGIGYNNKAYIPFRDIFFSSTDGQNKLMFSVFNEIESFFNNIPGFGPDRINLIRFLKIPSEIFPESIMDQLVYIIENWGDLIGDLRLKLLTGLDHLKEENKIRFSGSGKTMPYTFSSGQDNDPDNFSRDRDWMSSLVLLAKSTYVWLDQLSGSYNTEISRLDQIPDEELDKIASRGFSGLWLIGIWERSKASAKIKKMTGNPEAMSSAYSIYDYNIAQDLGGEEAFLSLKEKAKKRGIRLAGDMVPNHMGIDSKWVCDNPDWFVSTDSSPFGSYTFNGPDLSDDQRYSIHLEDHYYDKSDASVVFELIEHSNGKRKYIYHGNDGTSMPWNDTAQLNYLRKDVREHVINTILRIAEKFKIIRFDAAMILAKKHFQRLWFPEPGHGGDIPSRAGRGMDKEKFNELFPKEFWQEVVERVAEKTPETLLLAEAFWMMEPYFVRTLGMHRVYNSAFMNFLKSEENNGFRTSIKNTIEFNPEILKRFANFMNNPDEETAVSQFGSDDKYFGVCTLLSTLPGLPMFGHGQIEGFREKYGMEYRKAYMDESPDPELFKRHQKEIFPLLKQREIFSQSEYFRLYDFTTGNGEVNEDVIAYSNLYNGKHSIVVFNNKYSSCAGFIHISSPFAQFTPDGTKNIHTTSLSDSLGIHPHENKFVVFCDNVTSLTYIRKSTEISDKGMYLELGAFKYHVFLQFRIFEDTLDKKYSRLHEHLNGRGVNDIEKLYDQEVNNPISNVLRNMFHHFDNFMIGDPDKINMDQLMQFCDQLFLNISVIEHIGEEVENNRSEILSKMEVLKSFRKEILLNIQNKDLRNKFSDLDDRNLLFPIIIPSIIIGNTCKDTILNSDINKMEYFSQYYFREILEDILTNSRIPELSPEVIVKFIKLSIKFTELFNNIVNSEKWISQINSFFMDDDLRSLIGVNKFEGKIWYHSDHFKLLIFLLFVTSYMELYRREQAGNELVKVPVELLEQIYSIFINSDKESGNLYENLKRILYKEIEAIIL